MNYTVAEAWIFRDELKREREKGWRRKKDVGRGVGVWYRGRIFCTRRCAAFTVLISRTKWLTRDLTGIDNYGLFHSLSCTPPPHPPSLSRSFFFILWLPTHLQRPREWRICNSSSRNSEAKPNLCHINHERGAHTSTHQHVLCSRHGVITMYNLQH